MTNEWIMRAIFLAVAALFVFKMFGGNKMSASVVREKIAAGATIIDVRSPGEFASGAYPGAKNIPLPDLQRRISEIPKDKPVVVYCLSGGRSSSAASILSGAGYTDVTNGGGLSHMPR